MGEELRIGHDPEQHVAYVASWIKALEDDPMEIVRACSDAEKINTFVMAFEQKLTQQQDGQDLSAAPASPDRPPAMDVPIAAVLDDPDTDRSHYRAYNHSYDPAFGAPHERLEAALVDAGFTRIGQVVGDDSRDWGSMWETAIERLSPVFGIAPDYEHMGNAYLERKGLAEDFATMGEALIQNPDRAHELIATYSAARDTTAAAVVPGNLAEQDTPINVPFREKNEAKAHGAKWDKEGRTWFVPAGTDLTPFAKWSQEAPSTAVEGPQADPATAQHEQAERPAQTTSDEQEGQSMADRPRTSKQPTGRQFLAVPYGERHVAKAAGARWDQAAKSWYAPPNSDPSNFARWKPENQPNRQAEAVTPDKEFADAMKALGLEVPQGHPMMDGKTHRVPAVGDGKGEAAGFYVGHLDGHPAGYIKNNRSGLDMRWKSAGYSLTEEERARLNAEAAIKREAREREQAATHEETASKVQRRAAGCQQIANATPYMERKGVAPTIGALTDGRDGTIHLPAIDADGKHWTTQYIQEDGTKRFAKDSHKEGCFHVVDGGRTPAEALAALAAAPRLMIGEGYATMNTIGSVVGHPTVSAFDSGNLPAVAKALRERFPDKPIFIVGEDDKRVQERFGYNPGKEKATEAAKLVDGKPLFPVFAPGEQEADPKRFTDFNDLAMNSSLGREGLERQVKAAVENPRAQALTGPRLRVDEETPQQRRSGPAIGNEQPAQRRGVRL